MASPQYPPRDPPPATVDTLLGPDPGPFALLHRPETTGHEHLDLLTGTLTVASTVDELPVPARPAATAGEDLLVLLPYRQLAERGFSVHDDGEPILALAVDDRARVTRREVLDRLPAGDVDVVEAGFDVDDSSYARLVERVLSEEIGTGAGSNFVIHRSFTAEVTGEPLPAALALFRTLLLSERGTYWTFVVHTGTRTFVGASPERHVSLNDGTAVMNPISGTYRYPTQGPDTNDVLRFLDDDKEADELFMVVDEELKMMARICDGGARVVGPRLKEMRRVAHTEYLLKGPSRRDVRDVLRETMFAPTVTGSPLENATRVIARHEPQGRSYYSGAIALVGHDQAGGPTLDSAILIRTAVLGEDRTLRMGVGATLVRDSDPGSEVAETHAKAAGLLAAINVVDEPSVAAPAGPGPSEEAAARGAATGVIGDDPRVGRALADRNATLSRFWLGAPQGVATAEPPLRGVRGLLVEAEDTFTAMLGHQLAALGADVATRNHADVSPADLTAPDLDVVLLGPGPGDPRDIHDPRITRLRALGDALLAGSVPFLSICLGHQMVCSLLGLQIVALPRPHQGTQQRINLFGRHEPVGFYNTFTAVCETDEFDSPARPGVIELSRDRTSGHVHGLRAAGLVSLQFHPESVLTQNGYHLLGDALGDLVRPHIRAAA